MNIFPASNCIGQFVTHGAPIIVVFRAAVAHSSIANAITLKRAIYF
ncbi:hypothetical protein [Caballeronia sp. LjRoot31]